VLVPYAFVATTINAYEVLVVKPLTVIGEDEPVPVRPPGEEITVYPVIAPPPTTEGAVKATDTDVALATVAVPIVGALGTFNPL
jgi:hypothetical protein